MTLRGNCSQKSRETGEFSVIVWKNSSYIPLGACDSYQRAKALVKILAWGLHNVNLNLECLGPTARSED